MLMLVACTAIPLAATAVYYAAATIKQLPQALATLLISLGFADAVQVVAAAADTAAALPTCVPFTIDRLAALLEFAA